MTSRWQAGLAFLAVGAILVAFLVWASSTSGHVQGHVYESFGGGPAGSKGSSIAVPGATVIVSSGNGFGLSVRTDKRGYYSMKAPAGDYMIGASVSGWPDLSPNGLRTDHAGGASELRPVRILHGGTVVLNLGWTFEAP